MSASDEYTAQHIEEEEALVRPDPGGLYDSLCVERARVCCTLHRELGVNLAGVEIVLDVLDRWRAERQRNRELLAQLREALDRRSG